jgi:aminoglycoside phosphotransferase (APT) family kinase protein
LGVSEVIFPPEVLDALGRVDSLTYPPQGCTSAVVIAETVLGPRVVKRSTGRLFCAWLEQEYRVLGALDGRRLPIARAHDFIRRDTAAEPGNGPAGDRPECWLIMDYLPGELLARVLEAEQDAQSRAALLRIFGQALAAIHAVPAPAELALPGGAWLDVMLERAAHNLAHFKVDGTPQLLERLQHERPHLVEATLIHGDYTIDNLLVIDTGGGWRLSGIIDWSGGALGDPRYDIALATRPQREAFDDQREADLVAFYEGYSHGGNSKPLSQDVSQYFIDLYEFF